MASLIDYILKRVHKQNRNFICIVVGGTGSGKSYACLTFAERLMKKQNKTFKIDNVCFGAKEFMDRTSTGKIKQGSVIIFEEGGVGMDNRNFYTATNKTLAYVFEVFRTDNIILFINVPDISFIDKKIRVLSHAIIEMKKINYNKNVSYGSIKFMEHSGASKKQYNKHLRSIKKKALKITNWRFPKPSDSIIKQYEARRKLYKDEIKIEAMAAIHDTEKVKEKENKRSLTIQDYVDILVTREGSLAAIKKKYKYMSRGRCRIKSTMLSVALEVTDTKSRMIKQAIENKLNIKP